MKLKILLFLILVPQIVWSNSLSPKDIGFNHYTIKDEKLGIIKYYLSNNPDGDNKPLLVYLDGSGAFPLFQEMENGTIGSTVVIDFQRLASEYKILLIGKPSIPFSDKVIRDNNGFPQYKGTPDYNEKLSLNWRVNTADKIINKLILNKSINTKKIIVLGFSEEAQLAPELAVTNNNITHLMLFGGNGLNQFFDVVIEYRMQAKTGEISESQAQKNINTLFEQIKDIYANPESTKKSWWGHSYKRWASFTKNDPYLYLTQLKIPIYIANGSLDENSVLSADYIKLEFLKLGKTNLTYKTYPNLDHQFNEITSDQGKMVSVIPKINEIMKQAFQWLEFNL